MMTECQTLVDVQGDSQSDNHMLLDNVSSPDSQTVIVPNSQTVRLIDDLFLSGS